MRATIFRGPREISVEQVPDAAIVDPTDAVVRITHACVCGSDLWFYRGLGVSWRPGHRTGHELMGVVDAVGGAVRSLKVGDRVIAPFAYSDGDCEFCRKGVQTSCINGGYFGQEDDGGQGEAARVPYAEATLVRVDEGISSDDDPLLRSLLPLTDVLPTGHHGNVLAGVQRGEAVAVIGDGAVGLCAVLAAKRLGAARILLLGAHEDRAKVGRAFGATDVVAERGEAAVERVLELTGGGAERVVECVGTQGAFDTAIAIARPGGGIGVVGIPHVEKPLDAARLFGNNIALRFGVAPARQYIPELLADIVAGAIDPGPVLTDDVALDDVAEGYRRMDAREAIKVMVRP